MKNLLGIQLGQGIRKLFPVFVFFLIFCTACNNDDNEPEVIPVFEMRTIATGLAGPMGIEVDDANNIWVAIPGTASNDGKVVFIDSSGEQHDAIINLPSRLHPGGDELEGPAHLLLDEGSLYILAANYLYKVNISNYTPGQTSIDASTLTGEDISAFVLSYPFVDNAHDSHPYNMIKGPDGDLYITDAGANAVIHRKGAGNYLVLAEVPSITNPTPVGPPMVQSVPTGIVFDGQDFLVTTLLGFPFPEGKAVVYKISMAGVVSVYQDGFTSLVDIAKGYDNGYLVLQFATFGATGFNPNTGSLSVINGASTTNWADSLNMPVDIKRADEHTWYISSMGDGSIIKATYQ